MKKGDLFPAISFCPFFSMLPGNLWVPSTKEASQPSWEPQVSRAAGGCPSGRSACQISASPSPALFIYLPTPPLRLQPGLDSHLCCSHTDGFPLLPPGQPPPSSALGLGALAVGQGDREAAGEGGLGRALAHSFLGRNSPWSLCQVPVLDAHGCSPS